jgi:hypothetical protein
MRLQWHDFDFIGRWINIVRSVVDQAIGNCKTEASRKPVMDEHITRAFIAWRQESMYTGATDWVWASPQKKGKQPLWLSTIMRYYIQPAARRAGINKKIGWHVTLENYRNTDALDGVLGAVGNTLLCPRCVPGFATRTGHFSPYSLFPSKLNRDSLQW